MKNNNDAATLCCDTLNNIPFIYAIVVQEYDEIDFELSEELPTFYNEKDAKDFLEEIERPYESLIFSILTIPLPCGNEEVHKKAKKWVRGRGHCQK